MKKELNSYDIIKGLTDFDEWSYCNENQMWYEDLKEILPQPTKPSEIVSDFICKIKVNHDGDFCDNWEDLEEDKGGLEDFARYVIGEKNGSDCTFNAVLLRTEQQSTIITFNDYGFLELESFINKIKTQFFATEYMEDANAKKFIAWTDNNNQTRLVIHSCRQDDRYLETLIDLTINKFILIEKLENIINIWKKTVYKTIKEQENLLKKKANNPNCEASVNHFFPEFRTPVRQIVEGRLKYLEREHNIQVLFAIENGSRAWNMASKNSDYDVRFVYKRNVENYISLNKPKDVFEIYLDEEYHSCKPEDALVDMVGFDLMKYMGLLSKSNPTAIEWLMSDIIYFGSNDLQVKQYIQENFNPQTLIHHYVSLCKKHYNRYISENKKVTHKMYLYMMRGLLNALYVYKKDLIPPLDFTKTIDVLKEDIPLDVYSTVKEIIEIKSSGLEKDCIERIPILDEFIEDYINRSFDVPKRTVDSKILNDFMRNEIIAKENTKPATKKDIVSSKSALVIKFITFLVVMLVLWLLSH